MKTRQFSLGLKTFYQNLKKNPVAFIEAFGVSCINSGFQCNYSGYSLSVKMYVMIYIQCKPLVVSVHSCSIYTLSSTNCSLRTHIPCGRSVCYSTNSLSPWQRLWTNTTVNQDWQSSNQSTEMILFFKFRLSCGK